MKKKPKSPYPRKPKREELTREEILKRMREFPQRKEKIIAAIRKVQD